MLTFRYRIFFQKFSFEGAKLDRNKYVLLSSISTGTVKPWDYISFDLSNAIVKAKRLLTTFSYSARILLVYVNDVTRQRLKQNF